ncbi:TrkA family potassium uptake protein [Lachnospiraceae bacterium OttesenSCG-928-E19]|nr:TrkA family potassium uptake protein [Lachnospiraceae bacterium OttesenSCG-928-E19]
MRKQYAVFGLGKFGESVALKLENLHCDVIVVDNSAEKIHEIADKVSYAMHADIEDPAVMRDIGARNLDGAVVGVSDNLEASIMATILAKEAGIPYILAKANNQLHADILKKVGADGIVFPEKEMGKRVAKNLVSTNFSDWIELSPHFSIIQVATPEKWVGKTLREINIRELYQVNLVGVVGNGEVQIAIDPDMQLEEGTTMILIGANDDLQKFTEV